MAVLIIGGVSASGKTTCGKLAAKACAADFLDADDLHPAANVEKMRARQPLTDEDREPWFAAIEKQIRAALAQDRHLFIACSVLKREYRQRLLVERDRVQIAFLSLSRKNAFHRAAARSHAFFPASLVGSQYQSLEEPQDEEGVTVIDANRPVKNVTADIIAVFQSILAAQRRKINHGQFEKESP